MMVQHINPILEKYDKTLQLLNNIEIKILPIEEKLKRYKKEHGDIVTSDDAWLSGWTKRRKIIITGSPDGALSDFQLKFVIPYYSGQTDFDDIRFTSDDKQTLLSHWLESKTDGVSANIFVKIPSIPANPDTLDIYVYYNNDVVSSISNGDTVFEIFINKNTTTGWNVAAGHTVATSGDYLRIYGGSNDGVTRTLSITATKYIMDTRFYTANAGSTDRTFIMLFDGLSTIRKMGLNFPLYSPQSEWGYGEASNLFSGGAYTEATEYIMRSVIDESLSINCVDHFLKDTDYTTLSSVIDVDNYMGSPVDVDILAIGDYASASDSDIYIKYIIFRKYTANEPTYAIQSEESK